MKRKKKKRTMAVQRSQTIGAVATGSITTTSNSQSQVIWYPTLPPRKTTWTIRMREAFRRLFI